MMPKVSSDDPKVTLRGRVIRIFYSADGFSAGLIETKEGVYRFAGRAMVQEDDRVLMRGEFKKTKWGRQLRVESFEPDMELDQEGLRAFLAKSKRFKGIGEARAKELVERFGSEFDHIVVNHPERLTEIPGITKEIAQGLREEWLQRREHGRTIAFLARFGLTPNQIDRLVARLGGNTLATVQRNPYVLIELIDGFGFRRVDDIALKLGVSKDDPGRIRAGIIYTLNQVADSEGSTCMYVSDFFPAVRKVLVLDGLDAHKLIVEELKKLLAEGKIVHFYAGMGREERFLALAGLFKMERYIAEVFRTYGADEDGQAA